MFHGQSYRAYEVIVINDAARPMTQGTRFDPWSKRGGFDTSNASSPRARPPLGTAVSQKLGASSLPSSTMMTSGHRII